MTKENQKFTIWQGEDTYVEAPVVDSDNNPKDLTGAIVTWKAYDSKDDSVASITKSTSGGTITIINKNATNDGVRISLVKADTQNLTPEVYYHECRIADSASREQVVFEGQFILKQSKTL